MLDTNILTLIKSFKFNINLIYISYRVNKIETESKIIYIEDYLINWNKFEQPGQPSFKEWLIDSANENIVKKVEKIKLIEPKNITIEIGISEVDADDKYWKDLFDIYRGYIDSNS